MTSTLNLYVKKDLYFAPKIKRSNIFLGDPVIGTFKKLSFERKLRSEAIITPRSQVVSVSKTCSKLVMTCPVCALFALPCICRD